MPSWRTTCESRQVACKSLSPPAAGPSVLTSVPIPANAGPLSALQSAQNCYCFPVCVCCLPPLLRLISDLPLNLLQSLAARNLHEPE